MIAEEVNLLMGTSKEAMSKAIEHLQYELTKVRTGKASPAILNDILVNYHGTPTALNHIANISTADARTIVIQPWEKKMLGPIEKGIFEANLGITPMNDGEVVRLSIPPLTEERRREMVKNAKHLGEEAKIGIRSARHKAIEGIKKAVKDGYSEDAGKKREAEVQHLVEEYSKRADLFVDAKEKDVMTV